MRSIFNIAIAVSIACFISGCASSIPLSPSQVNNDLPALTKSTYYNAVAGKEAIASGKCNVLVEDRKFVSPLRTYFALNDGAMGIDEWVQVDGGNAYILNNFEWTYPDGGDVERDILPNDPPNQLVVYFDTLLCEEQ